MCEANAKHLRHVEDMQYPKHLYYEILRLKPKT